MKTDTVQLDYADEKLTLCSQITPLRNWQSAVQFKLRKAALQCKKRPYEICSEEGGEIGVNKLT